MRRSLLLIAAIVCVVVCPRALAQISPGPLSRAHQSLNGTTQCTTCHAISAGQATFKCLECHSDIATRLAAGRGLHASYLGKTTSSQGCVKCHSDHNGEDFILVRWTPTPEGFDHSKTGYVLQGKHAGLDCKKCHSAEHIPAAERSSIKKKDLSKTFIGLSQQCATCHRDEHQGRLGPNCQSCHNFENWTTTTTFDHSKTKYPLTGAHVKVACAKCHINGSDGKPRYADLPFDRCSVCHSDPHHGSFKNTCSTCHVTSGWKVVSMENVSSRFDHSKTKYPLVGKHLEVTCDKCHKSGDFTKPIAFQNCADCHTPDPHHGQFTKRADGGRCESCHVVQGFVPSTFSVKDHNATTKYALAGKHANVDCEKCHVAKGDDRVFNLPAAHCLDCHHDMHEGQFAAAPYLNRCEECHTVDGYVPSTFTLASHKKTRFKLTGAHEATTCAECHKPSADAGGKFKTPQFRFADLRCDQCHRDPHSGQFKERMLKTATAQRAGCETCHSTADWKDVSSFDHSTTDFALTGSHRAVACIDCHKPADMGVRLATVNFHAASKVCENCHEDPHAAQFAKAGNTHCADCHNTNKWKPSLFDHSKTALPLEGVHKDVRCERCHTLFKTVDDKQVLFYKPTPKECAACHGSQKT